MTLAQVAAWDDRLVSDLIGEAVPTHDEQEPTDEELEAIGIAEGTAALVAAVLS